MLPDDDLVLSRDDLRGPPYNINCDASTLRRRIRNKQIPAPFKVTQGKFGRLGWLKSEMDAWHRGRLANRQTFDKKAEGPKPPQDERGRFKGAEAR